MKIQLIRIIAAVILLTISFPLTTEARRVKAKDAITDSVMQRIFCYAQKIDTTGRGSNSSYAYTKFQMRTNKRNATLALVPTMYAISYGAGRKFISEFYNRIEVNEKGAPVIHRLLNLSTIPHRKSTMSAALNYMTPNVYGENLFQENILSPFHRSNRQYYKYSVTPLLYGMAQVYAYPRIKNTQLVETRAIVRIQNGQIQMCDFEGEYDMTRFYISVTMGKKGYKSLGPVKCDMRANFSFMGNKITGKYTTIYDLPKVLEDTIKNSADTAMMSKVRPIKLNTDEEMIYRIYYDRQEERKRKAAAQGEKKKDFAKDVLWDIVGDNLLNRISSDFGKQQQGYFRIDPLFNPLYMGYSESKGVVYKFKINGQYAFNDNIQLSAGIKGGYSFRQHRFYYSIPVRFNYNTRHEGYLQLEIGNGNRINTNKLARQALGYMDPKDSIGGFSPAEIPSLLMGKSTFTEFKDNYMRLTNHWRLSPHWAMELGMVAHNRIAIRPDFYQSIGYPDQYKSVAPAIGIEWRPKAEKGIVLKLDYEQGFKNLLGSNIDYGRAEFDAQTILYSSRRQSYSMRFGTGFYTRRGAHWDFVDYTNFHDNNIPGGWNDEWSGDFELLSSYWYNASNYYLRANFTYESPMILASWLPLIGRYVESERLYTSGLVVKHLYPYTEWGYGVSTRLISLGFFAAFRQGKFDGIGCRFGFELFRNW